MAQRSRIRDLLSDPKVGELIKVMGWVKTRRGNKNVAFIAINDGSTIQNIQAVADLEKIDEELIKKVTTGACISVSGELVQSQGKGQSVELLLSELAIFGEANPEEYPLQPKKHSLEFLREIAHLRPRTNTFGAVLRVRHQMIFAVHSFFHGKGFCNLHTPIITGF